MRVGDPLDPPLAAGWRAPDCILPSREDDREPVEEVPVGHVHRRSRFECRDRFLVVAERVLPEATGVVPGRELSLGDHAAAGECLVSLCGARRVARLLPDLGEQRPRDDVARVFRGRPLDERTRLVEASQAHRRLACTRHENGHFGGPRRRRLEQAQRGLEERLIVGARASMGLEACGATRAWPRFLGGGQLHHLARRLPRPLGAPHAQLRRELRVRRGLPRAGAPEGLRDRARHRLELLVAPLADEVLLDVPQAYLGIR